MPGTAGVTRAGFGTHQGTAKIPAEPGLREPAAGGQEKAFDRASCTDSTPERKYGNS
jgi:hypothetical protein